MKKIGLVIIAMVVALVMSAQGRENRTPIEFTSTGRTIDKATGWAYNESLGEWIDYDNVISDSKDYKERFKSLRGAYMMSMTHQSFIEMQFKTVVVDGVTYYVLVVKKWNGSYEYPSIREDWRSYVDYEGYIFEASEYNKLTQLDSSGVVSELKTKKMVTFNTLYKKYDQSEFLALIQTEIKEPSKSYSREYIMPIMLATSEGIISARFYVPEQFSYYSNYDFAKQYFEVTVSVFNTLLL